MFRLAALALCAVTPALAGVVLVRDPSPSDIQTYLDVHNAERAQHGANALVWNSTLSGAAQSWANGCVFQHSGGSLGPYGENLAAGTGSYSITDSINSWDSEESQYDPSNPQYSHWTQVVWKGTTDLGCAVATCNGIFDASYGPAQYYVCEYYPAGNVIGEFAQNVQK
ncbi:PR-1-like protein [Coniophora puteana RWD-64-598 SS2]|uniref:PR-1-like protein n=1 Tax=Coniophora puteana (strain RWD-64-598) TaxID=741705 RepID=A0A5M3N651_CONPW|nr:PR-1-like protein [Coniophora puteana RWD-64-598 SS2]EIW86554.1 PR-1-like protein [Coniophora puteana RWD-64-598 SS2]